MCVCLYYNLCNTLTATLLLIKIDNDHFSRSLRFVITDQFSLFFPENEDVPLTGR